MTTQTGRKKILVVDDSDTARMMTMTVLRRDSYEIVAARDGQEGIEKARTERPDLIVMDVMMPKMTGIEACAAMRKDPSTAHIPILLVTTLGEKEDVAKGLAAGCTDYLTKPVNGTELLAKIRTHLRA